MVTELSVHAVHHGEMRMAASAGQNVLQMDTPLNDESPDGFRPLEALLASLAGSSGDALAMLLTRVKAPFEGLEVTAKGVRSETHPRVFTSILLEFTVHGENVRKEEVARALKQAEEKYCPVWAMLKASTIVTASFKMVAEIPA